MLLGLRRSEVCRGGAQDFYHLGPQGRGDQGCPGGAPMDDGAEDRRRGPRFGSWCLNSLRRPPYRRSIRTIGEGGSALNDSEDYMVSIHQDPRRSASPWSAG